MKITFLTMRLEYSLQIRGYLGCMKFILFLLGKKHKNLLQNPVHFFCFKDFREFLNC